MGKLGKIFGIAAAIGVVATGALIAGKKKFNQKKNEQQSKEEKETITNSLSNNVNKVAINNANNSNLFIACPICRLKTVDTTKICSECGYNFVTKSRPETELKPSEKMFCTGCGYKLIKDNRFCENCGMRI